MTSKQKITNLLKQIYPETNPNLVYQEINSLIQKTIKTTTPSKKWDQSVIALICYADIVRKKKEKPIKTLHQFLLKKAKKTINLVHLLPFFPYSSDDGFSVIDYQQVDPFLGSWNEIRSFSKDFDLIFDAVINHISSKSSWFQSYLERDKSYENYFINQDPKSDLSKVIRPRDLPLLTPYKSKQNKILHIWTTFSEDQIDLNFKNPKVLIAILKILLFYASNGANYIRLDAIGFLWKELGTTCMHLKQTHFIIKLIRLVLDTTHQNVKLISETNVPHEENISYFGSNGDEAQMVYQFPLPPLTAYSLITGDASILTKWAKTLPKLSEKTTFFNFLASHDGIGMRPTQSLLSQNQQQIMIQHCLEKKGQISYKKDSNNHSSVYELNINYLDFITQKKDSKETAIKKFLLAHSILMGIPGIPGVYFHSFFGSQNDLKAVKQKKQKRSINREKLFLKKLEKELANKNHLRYRIYSALCDLILVRKEHSCFHPNSFFKIHSSAFKELFIIERKEKNSHLIMVHNTSKEVISFSLSFFSKKIFKKETDFIDILTQEYFSKNFNINLIPHSFYWLSPK